MEPREDGGWKDWFVAHSLLHGRWATLLAMVSNDNSQFSTLSTSSLRQPTVVR